MNRIIPLYRAGNIIDNVRNICHKHDIYIGNLLRKKSKYGLILRPATYPFENLSIDKIGRFEGYRSTKNIYIFWLIV